MRCVLPRPSWLIDINIHNKNPPLIIANSSWPGHSALTFFCTLLWCAPGAVQAGRMGLARTALWIHFVPIYSHLINFRNGAILLWGGSVDVPRVLLLLTHSSSRLVVNSCSLQYFISPSPYKPHSLSWSSALHSVCVCTLSRNSTVKGGLLDGGIND